MSYNVITAHISGPNFPYQIGLIHELTKANQLIFEKTGIKENWDLGLGSSGGNLAIHILNASRSNNSKLKYFSSLINSTLFARRWIPFFLEIVPSILGYILYGTLYKEGYGGYETFCRIYKNTSRDEDIEIWTGTYDVDMKRAQFFCNKSRNDSRINQSFFDHEQELYASKSLIYCNGNLKMIYESALASASIPLMVPYAKINGVNYGDGGIMYASPLTVFYKEIYRIVSCEERKIYSNNDIEETEENKCIVISDENYESQKNLRLYYIMRANSSAMKVSKTSKVDVFISAINASSIQDKNSAINLLIMLSPEGIENERFMNINFEHLADIIQLYKRHKHYILCLYPHADSSLNLANFKGQDVLDMIDECCKGYGCEIWYSKNTI